MSASSRLLAAEPLVRGKNILGEGPLWVVSSGRLLWTDILAKCLYSLDPDTGEPLRHELASYVACMGETEFGEIIAASGLGWLLFHGVLSEHETIAGIPFDAASVRFNDGKIGPDGAFWVGTMDLNGRDFIGALYRLAAGCTGNSGSRQDRTVLSAGTTELCTEVGEVEKGLTISNGIGWSPDAGSMYLTDSKDCVIYRYDFDRERGIIENQTVFVQDTERTGVPDGLAVDAEGNLWSARWGAGAVICYDPKGHERARIELPAVHVSSCCFGGEALDILYITTARYGLANPGTLDGALFACDRAGKGAEPYRFVT
jgi:sugar lactone lactonase YvrE